MQECRLELADASLTVHAFLQKLLASLVTRQLFRFLGCPFGRACGFAASNMAEPEETGVSQDDGFEALAAIPDGECGACEQKFDDQDEAGPTLFDHLI